MPTISPYGQIDDYIIEHTPGSRLADINDTDVDAYVLYGEETDIHIRDNTQHSDCYYLDTLYDGVDIAIPTLDAYSERVQEELGDPLEPDSYFHPIRL